MGILDGLRRRLKAPGQAGWVIPTDRVRRSVRCTIELTRLEDRRLMAIGTITEVVTPHILTPNHGEGVTVEITGTVEQILTDDLPKADQTQPSTTDFDNDIAVNNAKPLPSIVGLVTDQYRQIEPRVFTTVLPTVTSTKSFFRATPKFSTAPPAVITVRYFDYSFPIKLQAKASSINRQYDITVFITDFEGASQNTAFAFVPYKSTSAKPKSSHG